MALKTLNLSSGKNHCHKQRPCCLKPTSPAPSACSTLASLSVFAKDEVGHLTDVPELVAEVLSPGPSNIRQDREAKLKLYSIRGVQEYWICDRFTQHIEVYRLQLAQLTLVATLLAEDELTSPLLPGFSVRVGWVITRGLVG